MDIDIKAVQQRELEILKVVAEICERNGLRYFLDAGTCLGAVRHQGFIPWDDDVDIGMPRKDFERFRVIAKKELPEELRLWDYNEAAYGRNMFLKVHDVRTTYFEAVLRPCPDVWTGIYVDIFPYDGFPAPGLARSWIKWKKEVLYHINWALRLPETELDKQTSRRRAEVRMLQKRFPRNWASKRLERMLRKYDFNTSPYVVKWFFWTSFPAACVQSTVKLPFEGVMLPCPADYETYLTSHYGDWRQLPPEEERRPKHAEGYYSLEKSYLTHWWETEEIK